MLNLCAFIFQYIDVKWVACPNDMARPLTSDGQDDLQIQTAAVNELDKYP
jgi:hypothetical protein